MECSRARRMMTDAIREERKGLILLELGKQRVPSVEKRERDMPSLFSSEKPVLKANKNLPSISPWTMPLLV